MYQNGEKLIEVARQLELPPGTVRRWKSIYEWDSERSDKNNERSQKERNKKEKNREAAAEAVEQVLSNPDLTDKHGFLCSVYPVLQCYESIQES